MSRWWVEHWKCDRCGYTDSTIVSNTYLPTRKADWSSLYSVPDRWGTQRHLCRECLEGLVDWWGFKDE